MKTSSLILLPAVASSFSMVIPPQNTLLSQQLSQKQQRMLLPLAAVDGNQGDENENEEEKGLVLDGLDEQLQKVKGKFETYEYDYLAAAKKRAELKVQSVESGAKAEDWMELADEKKELFGEVDDWENAVKEAGNKDSQILMFTEPAVGEDGDNDGEEGGPPDEPKLLLF